MIYCVYRMTCGLFVLFPSLHYYIDYISCNRSNILKLGTFRINVEINRIDVEPNKCHAYPYEVLLSFIDPCLSKKLLLVCSKYNKGNIC